MPNWENIDSTYLKASKSIDTYVINGKNGPSAMYVYNDEGICYRIFQTLLELIDFIENGIEPRFVFYDDNDVSTFFGNLQPN